MKCFVCQFDLPRDALQYLGHIMTLHPLIFSMLGGVLQTQNYSLGDVMQAMLVTQLEDEAKYKIASDSFCRFMEVYYFEGLKKPSYVS